VWDALDSYFNLNRAMGRIQTDPTTVNALRGAVTEFIAGAALAYLCMGLMAGLMATLLCRIWAERIQSTRAWLGTLTSLFFISTCLGIARQLITFPSLYAWFPYRRHWAEFAEPMWVDIAWVAAIMTFVGLGWGRWGHDHPRQFFKRLSMAGLYAAAITALLQPIQPQRAQDNDGPNLVLIGVDALRLDRLGHFGNTRNTSPNIDKFLASSLVYTQAFTQIARTYPAWTTTLSGTWPTVHGIRDNLPTADKLVPDQALLPAVMRNAGYATGFATDDSRFSYMVPETGFEMIRQPVVGLQNFAISINEPRFRAFHGLLHNRVGFSFLPVQAYNQSFGSSYRPQQFVDWAVDGLAELSRSGKFFYAMHSCVLHVPGDRVYPWYRMFDQDGYTGKNRFKYSASGSSLIVNEIEGARGKKAEAIAIQDLKIYDSGIRMADDLVGAVLEELEQSGLADNTIVILFSDHGEEIWEPDLPYKWRGPNHGFHMYGEGHSNVVFAIRFPDGAHAGETVDSPIRLIDLAPTVAELFGLEWPSEVSGRSIMPLARGETEDADRLVYMETGLSEPRYWATGHKKYPFKRVSKRYEFDAEADQVYIRPKFLPRLIAAKDRAVQRGKYKLIWHALARGIRVDLYDRLADPINRVDLAEDYPEVVEALAKDLLPFLAGDGIDSPPIKDWVRLSRGAKRKDKRYRRRMKRLGGTMGPRQAAKP
jgi:arylsulfatase A-like enzyme